MDEAQFRATYNELNPQRCVFEKAINSRRCDCHYKRTFLLANREGVKCEAPQGAARCAEVLENMRQTSRFALKLLTVDGPLLHRRELQVQAGGITQLNVLAGNDVSAVPDIDTTISHALTLWDDIAGIPYHQLVSGIAGYQLRAYNKKR